MSVAVGQETPVIYAYGAVVYTSTCELRAVYRQTMIGQQ